MVCRVTKIVAFSCLLALLTACGISPRKQVVVQGDSHGTLAGRVDGREWLMSGGQGHFIDYEGGPKIYVVLWGPIPHTPCQPYNDKPETDARTISFLVDHGVGPQSAKDQLFAFTYPEGPRFATSFATEGTVTLTDINSQTISGEVEVLGASDNKCSALGKFTVQVCATGP